MSCSCLLLIPQLPPAHLRDADEGLGLGGEPQHARHSHPLLAPLTREASLREPGPEIVAEVEASKLLQTHYECEWVSLQ